MGGSVGKYFDDYEREADYQNWLYYRESSHEERESQSLYVRPREEPKESVPKAEVVQAEWPVVDLFSNYPEHKALIEAAEQKYFNSRDNVQTKVLEDVGDEIQGGKS